MKSTLRSAIAAFLTLGLCLSTTGCQEQKTAAALIGILGTSVSALAATQGHPELVKPLQDATAIASQTVLNWKKGQSTENVVSALNLVLDALNQYPFDSQSKFLIDLAIGTVNSILVLFPSDSGALTAHSATPRQAITIVDAPKSDKEFKARWNAYIASNPALTAAKIQ